MICKTATGREVPASLMIRGSQYQTLMIFADVSAGEAARIFSDPAETARLEEIHDDGAVIVHEHFTRLYSITPTTVATGRPEIMVWLYREEPEDAEEVET